MSISVVYLVCHCICILIFWFHISSGLSFVLEFFMAFYTTFISHSMCNVCVHVVFHLCELPVCGGAAISIQYYCDYLWADASTIFCGALIIVWFYVS